MTLLSRLATFVAADATGVLWLRAPTDDELPRLRLELVRGWVHALLLVPSPGGEDEVTAAVRLSRAGRDRTPPEEVLGRALAAMAQRSAASLVESDEPRARLGSVTPFHPLGALRSAARQGVARLRSTGQAMGGWAELHDEAELTLGAPIHPSAVAPDEQRAVQILSAGPPIRLALLRARAGCAPSRLDGLVAELAVLGGLLVDGVRPRVDLSADLARANAEAAERRRAYHAAARQTHPDLYPDADEETRRKLGAEMAELAAKHRRREE